MSYIGKEPQFTQYPSKFFNGDGTAMTVSLDYAPPNAAALLVFIDGVRQDTSAYTLSGTSLTFTGTVPSGTNNVQVVHLGLTQDVGVPSDDTISTVKIQDDAVTSAKLDTNIAIDGDLTVDTDTLHVDSTNNKVGIGTSNPVSMIQVGDTSTTSNTLITVESVNNTLAGIDLMGDLSGTKGFRVKYEGNGNYFAIEDNTSSVLTERMRVDSAGRVTMPYQPSFYVRFTSGAHTSGVIPFNEVQVNVGSHYSTSTGRFTAPIAGKYVFFTQVASTRTTNTGDFGADIRKNGTTIIRTYFGKNSNNVHAQCSGSCVMDLAANDYVDVSQYANVGVNLLTAGNHCNFGGHIIG